MLRTHSRQNFLARGRAHIRNARSAILHQELLGVLQRDAPQERTVRREVFGEMSACHTTEYILSRRLCSSQFLFYLLTYRIKERTVRREVSGLLSACDTTEFYSRLADCVPLSSFSTC